MVEMTALTEMAVLNEIVMPVLFFKNGEVVWINSRCKNLMNIKDVSDLKEKHFLKYLDRRQPEGKSLREIVNQLKDALSDEKAEKNLRVALKIKGLRLEAAIRIVPTESEFPDSGFVIFDRLRRKGDALLRRKTEHFYGDLFRQVSVPIAICDSMDRVVDINAAFSELFGYSKEEAVEKYCYDLIVPPSEKIKRMNVFEEIHNKGIQKRQIELVDKWGRPVNVDFTGHPILENGKIVGTYRIYEGQSDKKRAREEIALQKAYFEGLFNTSTEALALLTNDDKVVYFNKAFENLFGYSLLYSKGKCINDIVAVGERREEAENISAKALKGKYLSFDTVRYHRDGSPIPVEIVVNPIINSGELLGIYAVYKDLTEKSRMKKKIEVQSQYFKQLFDKSLDAMALLDSDQRVMDINRAFVNLFGYGPEECIDKNIDEFIVSKEYIKEAFACNYDIKKGVSVNLETKRKNKAGELIDVEASGNPITVGGKIVGTVVNYRDIRGRKHVVGELEEQRAYFKQLFDNSPLGIVMIDTEDRVVDINKGFGSMFGYGTDEARGKNINSLIAPESRFTEAERLSSRLISGNTVKFETKRKNKAGELIDVDILAYPVWLNGKQVGGYGIYSDITEKKRAEKEIEFLAYRDSLTGLFNRKVFYDKLRSRMGKLKEGEKLAVCYMDLDGFKNINDSMGHNVGDEILRYVAKNIEDSIEKEDVVARMGGDEFVVLTDCGDNEKIASKMEGIIERLDKGLRIFDYSIKISLSIGVAICPEHGKEVEEIIKKADMAMYQAKESGTSGYLIFTSEMEKRNLYRFKLESRLKMALSNGEIQMHYQPILAMDGKVKGCEALMRWDNPVIGRISPSVFIPIAEDCGEIHQLGAFAINQSLTVLKKWKEVCGDDFFMSINLSVKQMERENIVGEIAEGLAKHGLEGKNVCLEITESCSTENVIDLNEKLSKLKEMGILISIDDFGTGYSSFRQLRDSYADYVKIDRSFVDGIDERSQNRAIVKAIVAMAKSLGAGTIVEGIETGSELETMKSFGCDMQQGYLIQAPGSEKIIGAFIKKNCKQ